MAALKPLAIVNNFRRQFGVGDFIPVEHGGTGATTQTAARTALGLAIGVNVQAWNSVLDLWAAINPSAKENTILTGTTGQFWRGDKNWTDTLIGNKLSVSGTDATEVAINIFNDGGGSTVLHYQYKNPSGGFASSGQLLGGAGSRAWVGADYSLHSTAAYHFVASETHTSTANGTNVNLLATPIGGNWTNRIVVVTANGDGDLVSSKGQSTRKINALERGRGFEILRMIGGVSDSAEISMASNAPTTYQTLFRGYALDGTLESMTATWTNRGTGFALCGHDGTALVGAKALLSLLSTDIWSSTNTPARIVFETTSPSSTTRTQRWEVKNTGHIAPISDNTYDIGNVSFRVREYFGANATINTSDRREKCDIVDMTEQELTCAKELAALPKLFKWRNSVGSKGDKARQHCSPIAQDVISVMQSHGLDPFKYGFVCYDEWDETQEILDEETKTVSCAYKPAGSRYSLRYDELQFFIIRAQEYRIREIENK